MIPTAVSRLRRAPLVAGLLSAAVLGGAVVPASAQAKLPPLPPQWPRTLQLGLAGGAGDAAAVRASAPLGLRVQHLSGGADSGRGWATWNPRGTFVSRYVRESDRAQVTPVFTYYQLRQSRPGSRRRSCDCATATRRTCGSPTT